MTCHHPCWGPKNKKHRRRAETRTRWHINALLQERRLFWVSHSLLPSRVNNTDHCSYVSTSQQALSQQDLCLYQTLRYTVSTISQDVVHLFRKLTVMSFKMSCSQCNILIVSVLNDSCPAALTWGQTGEGHQRKTYLNVGTSKERGELLAKPGDSWRKRDEIGVKWQARGGGRKRLLKEIRWFIWSWKIRPLHFCMYVQQWETRQHSTTGTVAGETDHVSAERHVISLSSLCNHLICLELLLFTRISSPHDMCSVCASSESRLLSVFRLAFVLVFVFCFSLRSFYVY